MIAAFRRILGIVALLAALLATGTTVAVVSATVGAQAVYPAWWSGHLDAVYLLGAFLALVIGLGLALIARPGTGRWLILASALITGAVQLNFVGAALHPLGLLLELLGPLFLAEGLLQGTDLPRAIGWGVMASFLLKALSVVIMGVSRGAAAGTEVRLWVDAARVVVDNVVLFVLAWALVFGKTARRPASTRVTAEGAGG